MPRLKIRVGDGQPVESRSRIEARLGFELDPRHA